MDNGEIFLRRLAFLLESYRTVKSIGAITHDGPHVSSLKVFNVLGLILRRQSFMEGGMGGICHFPLLCAVFVVCKF